MSEMEALEKRRAVVTDQITRIRQELAALEAELLELDLAGNVLSRVTGNKYAPMDSEPDLKCMGVEYQCKSMLSILSAKAFNNSQHAEGTERYKFAPTVNVRHFAGGGVGWHIMAKKKLSLPEKITVALEHAHNNHVEALAPKDIERYIVLLFGSAPEKQNVNSVVWRMAKTGTVCKADDAPMYWLPETNKTADTSPGKGQSAALSQPRAKGREAVPGGGT
ncbi:hypothetical protein [Sinorhizobium meliloti]|nr:hypothetical protein [Sinorhizobium meliloti]MDE3857000.1 hypothetical protein [Sinorhizobium meliloti]MQW47900.1 hypothetical protein [Sinorhizobium meliloti]